ncbi:DMT family transporter [Marinilabilia rubra]|uniref:EamA/RhaT family transporter n=1 Tax=Marinilabilia rubra TaxID=2162893 RepID=A0A2U2B389_9BACT|nr:DMT family transporter [Marinilabilia rubra]PWD97531.1 EamA/RhaT family transporter [Marinilabilia rubra]
MTDNTKGLLYATATASLWGTLAIVLKISLSYFDPYTVVWWRFAMAFTFLLVFFSIKKPGYLKIVRRPPLKLILAGVLLGINYIGFMQGVHYTGPAVTQVMIQVGPLTLALTGILFFKEKISRLRGTGFFIALSGFSFFYFQQLQRLGGEPELLNLGVLWIMAGAWAWTGYAVLNKILVRSIPSAQINLILYGVPALLYVPLADFSRLLTVNTWEEIVLLLFMGGNTLAAYGALSLALKYTEANKVSMIITVNPIITFLIMELLIWTEVSWFEVPPVNLLSYLGALLVLIGALLAIGVIRGSKGAKGKEK